MIVQHNLSANQTIFSALRSIVHSFQLATNDKINSFKCQGHKEGMGITYPASKCNTSFGYP